MNKIKTVALLGAIFTLFFTSCGAKSSSKMAMSVTADYAMAEPDVMYEEAEVDNGFAKESAIAGTATIERKLIRTGNVSLEVQSLAETRALVESWVKKYNGYISDTNEWRNGLSITVNIPSNNFEVAMSETGSFGKVSSKNMNTQDVTEHFYDLDSRLQTKKIMLARLEEYLKSAKDIKDLIEIETKINDVTSDVEAMQGQMNRLSSQISFSRISIDARLPANTNEAGFVLPDTKSTFREFIGNTVFFFEGFLFAVLYIIVYGVPIVLGLLLLYYVCFGKIGLLKKLYHKAKGSKKE